MMKMEQARFLDVECNSSEAGNADGAIERRCSPAQMLLPRNSVSAFPDSCTPRATAVKFQDAKIDILNNHKFAIRKP
jgi:hypothetical protein